MNPHSSSTPKVFDPLDPHGFGDLGEHHGHHVTNLSTLVKVLVVLLFLTALTAFAAEFETYLITEMGWNLPLWVNIFVAMGIAVVKASLVLLFFMGLKFENPLYAITFIVSMFVFSMFLSLTGLDLKHRGEVYHWKQSSLEYGGTGVGIKRHGTEIHVEGQEVPIDIETFNGPLAIKVREQYIKEMGLTREQYEKEWAEENHIHLHHGQELSDANHSRPFVGLSGSLDLQGPAGASPENSHSEEHE